MADYISREAAINEFCDGCMDREWCKIAGYSCSRINNINAIPAVDVVEVVRCKDCKHYNHKYEFKCVLPSGLVSPDYDDFCSKGERSAE